MLSLVLDFPSVTDHQDQVAELLQQPRIWWATGNVTADCSLRGLARASYTLLRGSFRKADASALKQGGSSLNFQLSMFSMNELLVPPRTEQPRAWELSGTDTAAGLALRNSLSPHASGGSLGRALRWWGILISRDAPILLDMAPVILLQLWCWSCWEQGWARDSHTGASSLKRSYTSVIT